MPSGPWYCHHCGNPNDENTSECTFCYHEKCSECPYYSRQTGVISYALERRDAQDPLRVHSSTVGMTPMNLLLQPFPPGDQNKVDVEKAEKQTEAENRTDRAKKKEGALGGKA